MLRVLELFDGEGVGDRSVALTHPLFVCDCSRDHVDIDQFIRLRVLHQEDDSALGARVGHDLGDGSEEAMLGRVFSWQAQIHRNTEAFDFLPSEIEELAVGVEDRRLRDFERGEEALLGGGPNVVRVSPLIFMLFTPRDFVMAPQLPPAVSGRRISRMWSGAVFQLSPVLQLRRPGAG